MQVPPHFLDLKYGEAIDAKIESKVLTRSLVAALIRDGWHWSRICVNFLEGWKLDQTKIRISFKSFYRNQDTRQSTYQELPNFSEPRRWQPEIALRLGNKGSSTAGQLEHFVSPVENNRFYTCLSTNNKSHVHWVTSKMKYRGVTSCDGRGRLMKPI